MCSVTITVEGEHLIKEGLPHMSEVSQDELGQVRTKKLLKCDVTID